MTTEEIIETFIQEGMKAYKKLNGKSIEGRKLTRHEETEIEGQTFSCWREYATYKMAEYIMEVVPESEVTVTLCGNDSTIEIAVTDKEHRKLSSALYSFLNGEHLI